MKESARLYCLMGCASFFLITSCYQKKTSEEIANTDAEVKKTLNLFQEENLWKAPDTLLIPMNDSGKMIHYGRSLIANTTSYFGPSGSLGQFTNGMNCQNCHLDAGTKPLGNNYSAVASNHYQIQLINYY